MRQIQIGKEKETVVERADYPPERLKAILGNEVVAVIGYGVQGPGQALNMRDNSVKVIIGQREKSRSWDRAGPPIAPIAAAMHTTARAPCQRMKSSRDDFSL